MTDTDVVIQEDEYVHSRLAPAYGDPDYIHLKDLLTALKGFSDDRPLAVLDYGCGGSPYRPLFPNADYRRADFGPISNLDYLIAEDGKIKESGETFDLVLSTQVAEHVVDPAQYFSECFRLIKPGGRLICSTHGTYPDHGCPYDFQRWTADGLIRDLAIAGFEIERSLKLTTNARATMYLIQRFSGWFDTPASLFTLPMRALRSYMHRSPRLWQKLADKLFAHSSVVDTGEAGHNFYLGLLIAARKIDGRKRES